MNNVGGHAAALVTILVWGSTFVVTKVLLVDLTATQILVVRFLAAGAMLVPFARGFFRWWGWMVEVRWMAAGFTGVTAYYLAENWALSLTLATDVGLLSTTIPLLTAVGASLTRGEPWRASRGWGALVAGLGVVAVLGNGAHLGLNLGGDLLAFGAALTFAAYNLVIRGLPTATPALTTVARTFLWGTVLAAPALAWDGGLPRWEVVVKPANLLALGFLVVLASGAAYALWNRAIARLGAVGTVNYVYLVPLVNTALAATLLGEPLTPLTVVGFGLIVVGVFWSTRGTTPRRWRPTRRRTRRPRATTAPRRRRWR